MARRIAMVHPAPWLPDSGGERNMQAIHASMHGRGLEMLGVCLPGPLRDHLRGQGLQADTFPHWRCKPGRRAAFLVAADALYRQLLQLPTGWPANTPIAVPADAGCVGGASSESPSGVAQALDALQPLCEPDPERLSVPHHHSTPDEDNGLLLAGESPPLGGAMQLMLPLVALRLRAAFSALQPEAVFADHPWDCLAAAVAAQGTQVQPVWYPQLSEADPLVDPLLLALRPRVVTCGDGVKASRFADAAEVASIPNGVDLHVFQPRSPGASRPAIFAQASPREKVLVTVGNLIPRKGGRQLIAACRLLALTGEPFHLYFIGGGPDAFRRTLQRDIQQAGLNGQVHLLGPRDDVPKLLPHADVFVLYSLAEGLPLSLTEAMACSVPCVASDLAGCREVAGPRDALLVLPDAPAALAAALSRVCRSATLRQGLAARGQARVAAYYDRRAMMDRFEAYFRALS